MKARACWIPSVQLHGDETKDVLDLQTYEIDCKKNPQTIYLAVRVSIMGSTYKYYSNLK